MDDKQPGRSPVPSKKYVLRKIVDESILVPVSPQLKNRDCLFVLNPAAAAVFDGLAAGKSLGEIEAGLLAEYEGVEAAEVRADVAALVAEMIEIEALHAPAQG